MIDASNDSKYDGEKNTIEERKGLHVRIVCDTHAFNALTTEGEESATKTSLSSLMHHRVSIAFPFLHLFTFVSNHCISCINLVVSILY